MSSNLYEKLLAPDPQDPSRLQGELAERWFVSEDGLTHSFVLRDDATCASGKPVTAADAAFSFQRAIRLNTRLSRRGQAFAGSQPRVRAGTGSVHLLLDSTGLELFG